MQGKRGSVPGDNLVSEEMMKTVGFEDEKFAFPSTDRRVGLAEVPAGIGQEVWVERLPELQARLSKHRDL